MPHELVLKPWGSYEVLYDSTSYKIKILIVESGHKFSLQRHKWRDEHWFVVKGKADVVIEGTNFGLFTYNHINIPKGAWHRVENQQQTPLVIVEVQTGNCFEKDIERKEDDYGRN